MPGCWRSSIYAWILGGVAASPSAVWAWSGQRWTFCWSRGYATCSARVPPPGGHLLNPVACMQRCWS